MRFDFVSTEGTPSTVEGFEASAVFALMGQLVESYGLPLRFEADTEALDAMIEHAGRFFNPTVFPPAYKGVPVVLSDFAPPLPPPVEPAPTAPGAPVDPEPAGAPADAVP